MKLLKDIFFPTKIKTGQIWEYNSMLLGGNSYITPFKQKYEVLSVKKGIVKYRKQGKQEIYHNTTAYFKLGSTLIQ